MIESSSWCFEKFLKYFPFVARRFAKNSRRCVPATVATVDMCQERSSRVFIKRRCSNWIRSESTRRLAIGNHDLPSVRSVSHSRIILGMYLHPFRLSISPRLFVSFSSPFAFSFRVSLSQQIAERITINTELLLFILISSDVLYSIVSLQKYIYHYFSALWLLKTYR